MARMRIIALLFTISSLTHFASPYAKLWSLSEDPLGFPGYNIVILKDSISNSTALEWIKAYTSSSSSSEDPAHVTDDSMRYEPVIMRDNKGNQFLCRIPRPSNETEHDSTRKLEEMQKEQKDAVTLEREGKMRGLELLEPLKTQCLLYLETFYHYQYCHGIVIRQYNSNIPENRLKLNEDKKTLNYILSRFTHPVLNSHVNPLTNEQMLPHTELVNSGEGYYLKQRWSDGTICEETGKPRSIEVQFHCHLHSEDDHIVHYNERSTCNYVMVINTPRLCFDPIFTPNKHSTVYPIPCNPIVDDFTFAKRMVDATRAIDATASGDVTDASKKDASKPESDSERSQASKGRVDDEGKNERKEGAKEDKSEAGQIFDEILQSMLAGRRNTEGDDMLTQLVFSKILGGDANSGLADMIRKFAKQLDPEGEKAGKKAEGSEEEEKKRQKEAKNEEKEITPLTKLILMLEREEDLGTLIEDGVSEILQVYANKAAKPEPASDGMSESGKEPAGSDQKERIAPKEKQGGEEAAAEEKELPTPLTQLLLSFAGDGGDNGEARNPNLAEMAGMLRALAPMLQGSPPSTDTAKEKKREDNERADQHDQSKNQHAPKNDKATAEEETVTPLTQLILSLADHTNGEDTTTRGSEDMGIDFLRQLSQDAIIIDLRSKAKEEANKKNGEAKKEPAPVEGGERPHDELFKFLKQFSQQAATEEEEAKEKKKSDNERRKDEL
ncbi:uncharacterized protein VTP21DRAFT_2544 [Calcarisporiella thermophila]|uniref:uncharacterized protein n=1 Tax=Calcarisporiella thermophila TaxID=911321 RepID=UPI00374369D5